ncbi:hypothetical protein A3Q56_05516 [Intoshia linei]|uniref:Uncharacterized protein n=1 Tax=Intoshia linei TaxID=1819745 RepID=A0A177AXP0_9BILA|nr:hypothetical protein A3Q56_05516 [Intoshia linei]
MNENGKEVSDQLFRSMKYEQQTAYPRSLLDNCEDSKSKIEENVEKSIPIFDSNDITQNDCVCRISRQIGINMVAKDQSVWKTDPPQSNQVRRHHVIQQQAGPANSTTNF